MAVKKSLKLNYIYNLAYQILSMIIPLVTAPYISRVLKPEGVGTYGYTSSYVTYFTMFAVLGTLTYGNREIAYLQDDRKKRSKVFWEIEMLSCISTAISIGAFLIFLCFCESDLVPLYAIQVISIISVATDISWLLQGMEEFGKIVGRNLFFRILNVLFIFIMVRQESDLFLYIAGMVILTLAGEISIWVYVPKYVDKPDWKELRPFRHLKATISLFIPNIAISVYTVFDKTMIGYISTKTENGYYESSLKVSRVALTMVTALSTVVIPRMGYYYNQKDFKKVKELVYQGFSYIWLMGVPMALGLAGIANNFVPWYYGPGYEKVKILLPIQALLILAMGSSNVTGLQYLIASKREKSLTKSVCIGAGLNLICNLILIPRFFSVGAAIASLIAETVIALVQLYMVHDEISVAEIGKRIVKYIIAGIVMVGALCIEDVHLTSSIPNTILMIVSGAVVYFVMLLILRDYVFIGCIDLVLKKLKIKK